MSLKTANGKAPKALDAFAILLSIPASILPLLVTKEPRWETHPHT